MNNKLIIAAIAVLAVLLAVILIFVSVGLDSQGEEPIVPGEEQSSSGSGESEEPEESSKDMAELYPNLDFSESDETENNNSSAPSAESESGSSSESSSSASNISGTGNSSGSTSSGNAGSSGNTSSNPSSGSSSGFDSEAEPNGLLTYEEYNALSAEEQMKYMYSFPSMEEYLAWYNAAKAKYEADHPSIEIGDGNIDLGEIIGGEEQNP